ncbi:MAG TPA: pentapeptide repeat-containing protein [Solirubrobacterales bacterium]|nr:pentapeptide repeat-containing protein [Solirubrobacterales bacterium]
MNPHPLQVQLSEGWARLTGRRREQLTVLAVVAGTFFAAVVVFVAALPFNHPAEGRKVVAAIVIGLGGLGLALWVVHGMLTPTETLPVDWQLSQSGLVLADVDLRGAALPKVDLKESDLTGAQLVGADLSFADLKMSSLARADLRGSDLRWANLSFADLRHTDLRETDLRHANLDGAVSVGARFEGALFNGSTRWPATRNVPDGAIFVEERLAPES